MPRRRPEDLTLDEWRAIGEKRAARRAEADRADAPLLARMIAKNRDPENLTLDEWREIGERMADEYAEADRADAPLFARQLAEDAMRDAGQLASDQHLRWRDDGSYEVVPNYRPDDEK